MIALLEALCRVIVFAHEKGAGEEPSVARAVERLEVKVESIRCKQALTRRWSQCPRCDGQTHAVICWQCKQELPPGLRLLDTCAEDGRARLEADEELVAWAIATRDSQECRNAGREAA